VKHVMSSGFWWGVGTTFVALWLWRNYGRMLPRLPGASNGG
jgi:hypothetical protein